MSERGAAGFAVVQDGVDGDLNEHGEDVGETDNHGNQCDQRIAEPTGIQRSEIHFAVLPHKESRADALYDQYFCCIPDFLYVTAFFKFEVDERGYACRHGKYNKR